MSKIKSFYLKTEFEVTTYEGDNGQVSIISHDALENIMHNQIPAEFGTKYDMRDMHISDTHCVIQCTINDNNGRRIQAIGESSPATLETDIARSYPALMAAQRAFDRAVIRYLQFPSKVFSNLEGVDDNGGNSYPAKPIDVTERPEEEEPVTPAPINNGSRTAPPKDEKKEPPKSAQTAQARQQSQPTGQGTNEEAELGAVTYGIGRYRSEPKTLAWLWEHDRKSIIWMTTEYSGSTESGKKLKEQCVRFRAIMEAKENG